MYASWTIKSQKTPAHFPAAPMTVSNSEFRNVLYVYTFIIIIIIIINCNWAVTRWQWLFHM
jgi:hypothetical protein